MQLLRIVSDSEEALQRAAERGGADCPTSRLQGVSRVGDVSKGLLLAPDRAVNLVLGCSDPPTAALLTAVRDAVEEELKEVAKDRYFSIASQMFFAGSGKIFFRPFFREYQVHKFEEEAGFCVVYVPEKAKESEEGKEGEAEKESLPYAVNVTLTCASLRDAKKEDGEEKEGEEKEDEEKRRLPLPKCQQALAEMRRSKWFVSNAANLPSCVESIKIFKEMSHRWEGCRQNCRYSL